MPYFPENVKTESVSRYISPSKLPAGKTKFRFLGDPMFFFETWIKNPDGSSTPKRFAMDEDIPLSEVGPDGVKQVMATKVYNYTQKAIQIMSITQVTILSPLKLASENKKYGEPTGYDTYISKTGVGQQSRYTFDKDPKEKLSDEVIKADKMVEMDLHLLLIGADPFLKDSTPQTVDKTTVVKTNDKDESEIPF